eukprot:gene32023-41529_t
MDTTDPETMWAMFDMATDPDPDPANTTGHEAPVSKVMLIRRQTTLPLIQVALHRTNQHSRVRPWIRFTCTCSEAMSKAMGEFMERQHHANQQWLLALQTGRAAYDALASATSISREFNHLRNAHMVLQHEFLDCLTRHRVSRKRGRDE